MPLPLFPYQEHGAAWLASRERAGLFDEMGVGKTATMIRALDIIQAQRVMVIAPAIARENWRGEFAKFALTTRRIIKGEGIHDFVAWLRGRFDTLITSYELATKWAPRLDDLVDCIITDEGHYLKNADATRTRVLLGNDHHEGIIKWAARYWSATGTPIPNDPVDIYTWLRAMRVMPLTQNQFTRRYFNTQPRLYSNRNVPIEAMAPELRALIQNNSIRRTAKEVGIELPPIFLTTMLVDGDTQAVRDLLAQHAGLEYAILQAINAGGLSKLDADHIMTLRRLIGEAKAVPYAHQLLYELQNGLDKMVVFGHHRKALTDLRDYLVNHNIHCVLVQGETPERQRDAAVQAFQADPNCRVFIGNIRTAGTVLTLTASANLDMLESDWSPGINAQTIKRVHRLTQMRTVRARFITLARSLDETVNRIVAEKTAAIAAIDDARMYAAPEIEAVS